MMVFAANDSWFEIGVMVVLGLATLLAPAIEWLRKQAAGQPDAEARGKRPATGRKISKPPAPGAPGQGRHWVHGLGAGQRPDQAPQRGVSAPPRLSVPKTPPQIQQAPAQRREGLSIPGVAPSQQPPRIVQPQVQPKPAPRPQPQPKRRPAPAASTPARQSAPVSTDLSVQMPHDVGTLPHHEEQAAAVHLRMHLDALNKSSLRTAIVLREVLDAPVAMRDPATWAYGPYGA